MSEFNVRNVSELVAAINAANSAAGADTINLLPEGTFTFTSAASNLGDYGSSALPLINTEITINGNFATIERSTSAPDFRIFLVSGAGGPGGSSAGKLTLQNVTVKNGRATVAGSVGGDDGGGLLNVGGTVTIKNSTFTNNFSKDDGGAINNLGTGQGSATMTIENSAIYGNTSQGSGAGDGGAGIENDGNRDFSGAPTTAGATLTIKNSTISANTVQNGDGGGIRNRDGATLTIEDTTIAFNSASTGNGHGIVNGSESTVPTALATTVSLKNTIVAGNSTSGNNLFNAALGGTTASITNSGNSLFGSNNAGLTVNTTPINNIIAALANNGGATQSHNLVTGSPALVATGGTTGAKDQRGADTQSRNDIGAVKLVNAPPGVKITLPDNTSVLDGTFLPITIANAVVNTTSVTTFKIRNDGQQDLTLGSLSITGTGFSQDAGFGTTTVAPGQETTFSIRLDTATVGTYNGKVTFTTNVLGRETFDFAIGGNVTTTSGGGGGGGGTTPVTIPPAAQNNIYTVGSFSGNTNLAFTVNNASIGEISDLRVTRLDAGNQAPLLFSILPNNLRPNGFVAQNQTGSFGGFVAGERLTFELFTTSGQVFNSVIQATGNNTFTVGFETNGDGRFNDVVLTLQQPANVPIGVGTGQRQDREIIDLTAQVGRNVTTTITINREALFNNFVGLYKIDDVNGTVAGIAPGQSGYAQAALQRRVTGGDLSVTNQGVSQTTVFLEGGALYAPFITVNTDPQSFLNSNPNNSGSANSPAYFSFLGANPDTVDHVRLLGNNVFGFEDLPAGGDRDYNDIVMQVNMAVV